jgi:hypothetical protein
MDLRVLPSVTEVEIRVVTAGAGATRRPPKIEGRKDKAPVPDECEPDEPCPVRLLLSLSPEVRCAGGGMVVYVSLVVKKRRSGRSMPEKVSDS